MLLFFSNQIFVWELKYAKKCQNSFNEKTKYCEKKSITNRFRVLSLSLVDPMNAHFCLSNEMFWKWLLYRFCNTLSLYILEPFYSCNYYFEKKNLRKYKCGVSFSLLQFWEMYFLIPTLKIPQPMTPCYGRSRSVLKCCG